MFAISANKTKISGVRAQSEKGAKIQTELPLRNLGTSERLRYRVAFTEDATGGYPRNHFNHFRPLVWRGFNHLVSKSQSCNNTKRPSQEITIRRRA